jgi:hypothetical protein
MSKGADSTEDLIRVLLQRFETEHLDRILALKKRVDGGQTLSAYEQTFLENVCQEALDSKYLVDRYPEYQPLYARVVRLYREITTRALENEQRERGRLS